MTRTEAEAMKIGDGPQALRGDQRAQRREQTPTLTDGDGFQRALALEQRALCDALSPTPPLVKERLNALVADLYATMRTPIFPKGGYQTIAEALVTAVADGGKSVYLHGALASPTARAEMNAFLHVAAIFRRHGFTPHVQLLLVQWENLVEIRRLDATSRARVFAQQVRAVAEAARLSGFADAVIPVGVEIDVDSAQIVSPPDFRDWSQRVAGAVHDPRHACPALVRDVAWSTAFYARQDSLRRLGEHQALLDLAIRRAIGRRASAEHATRPHLNDGVVAMITSELHKRFLPCYAASLPIVNIDVRAQASGRSASAVA